MAKKESEKPNSKKVIKKTTASKTVKKTTRKKVSGRSKSSSPVKKSSQKNSKKTPNESASMNDDFVILPDKMKPELVKKTKRLQGQLDDYILRSVYTVAYVSAICFISVGSTLSLITVFGEAQPFENQSAQIVGTTGTISEDSDLSINTSTIGSTEFNLLTDIPSNITTKFPVKFIATNVDKAIVKMFPLGGGSYKFIPSDRISNTEFVATVPAATPHGYYELRIHLFPLDGAGEQIHSTGKFFFGSKEAENLYNHPADTETSATNDNQETTSAEDDISTDVSTPLIVAEPIIKEPKILIDAPTEDSPATDDMTVVFELIPPTKTQLFETAVIGLKTSVEQKYIELYARPLNAKDYRFVTLGTKRTDKWQFVINTKNLPNGDYEFLARSRSSAQNYETKPIKLTIKNDQLAVPVDTTVSIKTTLETPLNSPPPSDSTYKEEVRDFVKTDDVEFKPTVTLESNIAQESDRLLADNKSNIDELLRRYATALQSGDTVLIEDAKKQLRAAGDSIAIKTFQDERLRDISDDLNTEIKNRLEVLQERVTTFEEIRRERSGGQTAIDTDGDGISDYDEVRLYKTDPTLSDTDNDGVSDGVEIVRGFNPLDSKAEAVIAFESPRDSIGLERNDVLEVREVLPVLTNENGDDQKSVRAEIRGKALPNSFVTLYIFSTPTVVTIKTDADGSYVYTFDKELEDGRHDVYVAVTDNAGAIIAQSNPFSFIKTAEAFSPVDAKESDVITDSQVTETPKSQYGTVFGVAILAFGIILLMLGIGLRSKRNDKTEADIIISADPNHIIATDDIVDETKSTQSSIKT